MYTWLVNLVNIDHSLLTLLPPKLWTGNSVGKSKWNHSLQNPKNYTKCIMNIRGTWWRHQMETFVREIHRSPVNFPHKGQWRGALMFSLIYAWINDWVNNREAGDLRRQHGHYDVIVMNILQYMDKLRWRFHEMCRILNWTTIWNLSVISIGSFVATLSKFSRKTCIVFCSSIYLRIIYQWNIWASLALSH